MNLVDDVIPLIISYLDYNTLMNFINTCRKFYSSRSIDILESVRGVIKRSIQQEPFVKTHFKYMDATYFSSVIDKEFTYELFKTPFDIGLEFRFHTKLKICWHRREYSILGIPGKFRIISEDLDCYFSYLQWILDPRYLTPFYFFDKKYYDLIFPLSTYRRYISIDTFKKIAQEIYKISKSMFDSNNQN